ncbi:MAG: glycosyltransferase family 4 protein [Pelosinus sp.]|nr:glycosyltransferase family 4 protein [Pelosinus sp.]
MNILLINHYAGSPKHGMEYRPYYMAQEWVKRGHNVTIVAANYSHVRSINPDVDGKLSEEFIDGIRYIWIKTSTYFGNSISRAINMFAFVSRLFRYNCDICNNNRFDAVIASSTYPLDIYPAYWFATKAKAKLIFEVHDLWPLSPIEIGGMSRWHPFIMVMQMAENFAYKKADKVVSMLPKACQHMQEHGMSKDKFVYIPNGICMDDWIASRSSTKKSPQIEAIDNLRKDGFFLIAYAGNHSKGNALESILRAADLLKDLPIKVILIGQGPEKEYLQQLSNSLDLPNILFLPPVRKEVIPLLLSKMDVLYIGMKAQSLFRFGISPNKLMDYMMSGKPVISAIYAGNDIVAESGCGLSILPENPQELAQAIIKLYNTAAEDLVIMGESGKKYVKEHHNYEVLAKKFLNVLGN